VLSIFIAFYTQQYGLAGLGGALLLLGLWGQYIAGLAGLEDFIIILIGLILIGIEIFVTPGFGAFGIVGVVLLIIGMFLAMIDIDIVNPLSDPFLYQKLSAAVTRLGYSLLLALILGFIMMRYIVPRAFWTHIALHEKEDLEKGYHSSEKDFESYIGMTGTAVTDLHPTGIARFGTERLDVVSPGNYIVRGTSIKIVKQEGRRLIVKEIKNSDQPEPNDSDMENRLDNSEEN
jgi:membrane-bound serine protease (ClpP class)